MHTLPAALSSNTYSPVSIWRGISVNIDSDPNFMSEINVFGEKKPRIPSGPARKTITIPPAPLISPRTPSRSPGQTTYYPTTVSPDLPLFPHDRPFNADNGDSRDPKSWSAWIITDSLQRSHSSRPHLFLSDIPSARVPARYKVVHSPDFGSSSRKAVDPAVANYVVNRMINSLPPGTPFAFTDGSANPNPGPAGAGLAYCRTEQKDGTRTPALAHTAALGLADNNTGELVAIGMALDMFKQQGGRGAFHIFSDSKATIHALTRGWNLGASCAPALAATRSLLANILQGPCSVRFHWVPGHSHIELNELADKAAGAGSKASALPRNADININYSCQGFSFSTLGTLFAQGAPPARAAN